MRFLQRLAVGVVFLGACTLVSAEPASAARHRLDIPAQPMSSALNALAAQTGIQIVFNVEDTMPAEIAAPAIQGDYSAAEALTRMLAQSGLKYEFVNDRTVRIAARIPTAAASSLGAAEDLQQQPSSLRLSQDNERDSSNPPGGGENGDSRGEAKLEEVVVTAQKREERLRDVPMSVTALTGDELARTQSYRFEDYVGKVPGLTLINYGQFGSQLVIRGLTTGSGSINSSVATYIDETPYTAEGHFGLGSNLMAPNLDTFDIQRIEVLRGPQGTLYGANALGGVLKYVSNAPDPGAFAANVETGVNSVSNGGTGFDMHGMVNMPLADNLALRLVGYDNSYAGFMDDPTRNEKNTNRSRFNGGRASMLYKPTSNLSIRLNALYQERRWDDWADQDVNAGTLSPVLGDLKVARLLSSPGNLVHQLYNVTLDWDWGFSRLISSSSYAKARIHSVYDESELGFGSALFTGVLGQPAGLYQDFIAPMRNYIQEVRLSSAVKGPWLWQVGGFFTNQHGGNTRDDFVPFVVSTGETSSNYATSYEFPTSYREYAAFANLGYRITSTLDASVGGRYSHNKQSFEQNAVGFFAPGGVHIATQSSEGVFTYSGDLRWHVTPENMLYGRVAKGFVPGGPNFLAPDVTTSESYLSSTTENYEVGLKSSLLNNHLTVEVSAFDIEWHRIQLEAIVNNADLVTNGGTARSEGIEWSLNYLPVNGLALNLNGSYTHARLTQPTPEYLEGQSGDRLPGVARWQASAGADYERALSGGYTAFAGIDWRFLGSRIGDFAPAYQGERQIIPSSSIVDARLGIAGGQWSLSLYAKNITNKFVINYMQYEMGSIQKATMLTPRTIGATLAVKFH